MISPQGFIGREEVSRRLKSAWVSVFAAVGLVLIKLVGAYYTHSLALYSEAGHSAVDLVAALVTLLAIHMAGAPPDKDHHYGHAKYESVAALVQLAFLFVPAGLVIMEAVRRLRMDEPPVVYPGPALAVMIFCLGIEAWRALSLMRAAKRSKSEALAASSAHFMSDFLDSIVVIIGLAAAVFGYTQADSIAALFVAAVILSLTVGLGRDVFNSLTDRAPKDTVHTVEATVLDVPRVLGVHDIRVRQAGAQMFAEMHVDLDPALSLEDVHAVLDEIEHRLHESYPHMHIVTHPEPFESNLGVSSSA